jgi:hypothetical protein
VQTIPVDVGRLGSVMCVVPAETRKTPDGEVRRDREGRVTWVIGLSVRQGDGRRADVIDVTLPAEPEGITEGTRVTVVDLTAVQWEIDGRSGTSFRAAAVRAVGGAPARGKAGGSGGESS